MKYRPLGTTGLQISEIGFGCGNTAGLMTQGTAEQERTAVSRALDLGINYFDTAPNYGVRVGGVGVSERHLGQVLHELGAKPIIGTKVEFSGEELADIPRTIRSSACRLELHRPTCLIPPTVPWRPLGHAAYEI